MTFRYRISVPATLDFDVYAGTRAEAIRKASALTTDWAHNGGLAVGVGNDDATAHPLAETPTILEENIAHLAPSDIYRRIKS